MAELLVEQSRATRPDHRQRRIPDQAQLRRVRHGAAETEFRWEDVQPAVDREPTRTGRGRMGGRRHRRGVDDAVRPGRSAREGISRGTHARRTSRALGVDRRPGSGRSDRARGHRRRQGHGRTPTAPQHCNELTGLAESFLVTAPQRLLSLNRLDAVEVLGRADSAHRRHRSCSGVRWPGNWSPPVTAVTGIADLPARLAASRRRIRQRRAATTRSCCSWPIRPMWCAPRPDRTPACPVAPGSTDWSMSPTRRRGRVPG